MISVDTNILLYAYDAECASHAAAYEFLKRNIKNRDFAICELVLLEFYVLLRNSAVLKKPLDAREAVAVCEQYRRNQSWRLVDYPGSLMASVWREVSSPTMPQRWVYDVRLALTLRHHGVTEFATRNVDDFQGFGFARVWSPLV